MLPLSDNGGLPDEIEFPLLTSLDPPTYSTVSLKLYFNRKAKWFIHPIHCHKVDVIAIEIILDPKENIITMPINNAAFSQINLEIAYDVFILGYPFNITGSGVFPIWKKGSIATEPELDFNELPLLLVDSTSKPGMSGSPVICRRHQLAKENGHIFLNTIEDFIGIYSGRLLGESNLDSQLGMVWKKQAIDEIIDGRVYDDYEY